ncbi:MAG: hypothetical protein E6Q89_03715 [Bacteroidia bacterium]|nr:MAG: hypothetical protein E6Q89_03715 [Bacteroidia bacterium]
MKTSNRLLIILLAIVLTLPFIAALNLRNKFKKNEFYVNKTDGALQPLRPFKVVEVDNTVGIGGLSCELVFGNTIGYSLVDIAKNNIEIDSLQVFYKGDTLVFKRVDPNYLNNINEQRFYSPIIITLYMPNHINVIAKNATINMNTITPLLSADSIKFNLSNNAQFNLNNQYTPENKNPESLSSKTLSIAPIFIDCNASDINLDGKIHIAQLSVTTLNNSSITIGKEITIDNLNSQISDETKITGSSKLLKTIK